jgi:hypothetical protein
VKAGPVVLLKFGLKAHRKSSEEKHAGNQLLNSGLGRKKESTMNLTKSKDAIF